MSFRLTMLVVALLLAAPAAAPAQPGETAPVVLVLPASARALGMGDAFVAVRSGEEGIFYNPAQMVTIPGGLSAALSVQTYLESSTLVSLAAAGRAWGGVLGVGLQLLNAGDEAEVVPDPEFGGERGIGTGGRVGAQDFVASVGYAQPLGPVSVGAVGKYIVQDVAGLSGYTLAADLGISAGLPRGVTVGAAVQNVGGELEVGQTSAPLPLRVVAGAAAPWQATARLTITGSVAAAWVRDGDVLPAAGVEGAYTFGTLAAEGRVGYAVRPDESLMSPLTLGAGVRTSSIALEYAFLNFEDFGATHRIGIRWWGRR